VRRQVTRLMRRWREGGPYLEKSTSTRANLSGKKVRNRDSELVRGRRSRGDSVGR